MKKLSRMLVALAIVIGAAYTSASAATVYTIVVGVDSNGTPTDSQDLVTPSFADGDSVKWVMDTPASSFTIQFDAGSPFATANFTSSGGAVSSGALTVNSTTTYKYSVWVNGKWLDPRMHVVGMG